MSIHWEDDVHRRARQRGALEGLLLAALMALLVGLAFLTVKGC